MVLILWLVRPQQSAALAVFAGKPSRHFIK